MTNRATPITALLMLSSITANAYSQTTDTTTVSRSISYSQTDTLDKATKNTQLKQSDVIQSKTMSTEGARMESTSISVVDNTSYTTNPDFSIYNATSELIDDLDADGFYHRFSVTIDADTLYTTSYVYAKLYLSYEGGPWTHYSTSDAYHINSDSEHDSFVIETELADGFPAGYYDIRIELYHGDTNEWLLSYGPYDDSSLSALPLEDSYRDDYNTTVIFPVEAEVVVSASGSTGALLSALPLLLISLRKLKKQ